MKLIEDQLVEAAKAGKTARVKTLLRDGANIHAALRWAAYTGNTEVVEALEAYLPSEDNSAPAKRATPAS